MVNRPLVIKISPSEMSVQHMILLACSLMQDPLIRISPIGMSVLLIICEACSPMQGPLTGHLQLDVYYVKNMVLMFSGTASFNHNLCLWGGKVPASVYTRVNLIENSFKEWLWFY